MLVGFNILNGKPVEVSEDDREKHMHVIGLTGAGKSKFLECMIRQDIDARRGLCIIDWRGDLYKDILKYASRKRLDERRLILIDPNDEDWAVGLNYLEHDGNRSDSSHAAEVIKGIAKLFGGENTDFMVRLQRWERNSLVALIERKLTLVELLRFSSSSDSGFRQAVLQEVSNVDILDEWKEFETYPATRKIDYINAVKNRANRFVSSERVKQMFGQVESTINFREAMDEGKVILVNLACGKISKEERKMLGIVIIDKLTQAGFSRMDIPQRKRKPFYVYLDEFAHYATRDIVDALQQLRKFQVRFILAHQELQQLREEDAALFYAVMQEPQLRAVFRSGRMDSEILAPEMFTGGIRGDTVKNVIEQSKFRPVEAERDIQTESESWSDSSSYFEGSTSGHSEGTSKHIIPAPETTLFGEDTMISYNEVDMDSVVASSSSGQSSTSGGSISRSTVPWYEYHPFKEVSSIAYHSTADMLEKYISWIKNQPDRQAQFKTGSEKPVPIITPLVKEVPALSERVELLKKKTYGVNAISSYEADKMIAERREAFEETSEEAEMLPEDREPVKAPEKAIDWAKPPRLPGDDF